MPRTKRTLAEADPNASVLAPAAKKASRGAAVGKENQNYKSKTVAELTSILKERGLPHTGKKAELIQRLADTTRTITQAGEATMAGKSEAADNVCYQSICLKSC
jgi:SAP domain